MLVGRRAFLQSLGLLGSSSLVGCRGAPLERLYAYLTPPQRIVPGVAAYYATVCRACPAGCGIIAKVREARPIKLEGNPAHPVNRGTLCARGQAFLQGLYGPARVTTPLLRREGALRPVSWEEAVAAVSGHLRGARAVGLVSGLESGSLEDLYDDFLGRFPTSARVTHEPASLASMAEAAGLLFGLREVPRIDLGAVDLVVSVGADLLDTFASPVELARQWAQRHSFDAGRKLELVYAGPRRNLTATAADHWERIPPTEIGAFVLGLAHALYARRRAGLSAAEQGHYAALLARLGPRPTGSTAAAADALAGRLATAARGLILFGGAEVLSAEATAIHAAALLGNSLLGAIGTSLRFGERYHLSKIDGDARVLAVIDRAAAGSLDVLVTHGADPVGTLPRAAGVAAKLEQARFVVALACERTPTTERAHVVLPVHHPLESWGDYEVALGVHGIMQPVRAPLHSSRHAGDALIQLATAAGKPVRHRDFKAYVVSRWGARRAFAASAPAPGADGDAEWRRVLVQGGDYATTRLPAPAPQLRPDARLPALGALRLAGAAGPALVVPFSALLYDGRGAHLGWLREVPDSLTQTAWDIPVEVAPDVAARAGIRTGDEVRLASPKGEVRGAALVSDDLVDGTVALRPGGGLAGDGPDPLALLDLITDARSGQLALLQTRVTVTRIGPGRLVRVSGGDRTEDRRLCLAVDVEQARAGRYPVLTRHGEELPGPDGRVHGVRAPMPHEEVGGRRPPDNMVPLQQHPHHRWGMTVDLDRCTGCGACVVACYAENNIPVVGREEVARGRELSWIRLERHAFGREPGVRFMPVMCQHCDQAPCETVCPVFAAYHTPDGLNAQIYNRCVGTRYCANNCPYKVRRFNYFDYRFDASEQQRLNPDVTVRSRGVMEKCTFCIQRIREATNRAAVSGRPVREGEIVPACVQTCPTGALAFGDFRQPTWGMTKLAREPRGYRLLDAQVNTRPGVVYLRKVVSPPGKA